MPKGCELFSRAACQETRAHSCPKCLISPKRPPFFASQELAVLADLDGSEQQLVQIGCLAKGYAIVPSAFRGA